MKKYEIRANFEKNILIVPEIELVENDYNSVEFDFSFDNDQGTKYIEIKKPNKKVWIKEIVDNKVVLVDYDENGKVIPVIAQAGPYEFEVSKYKEDSKYTINQAGKFYARDEVANVNDEMESDVRLPILDDLINNVETLKNDCNESTTKANNAAENAKEATENANKKAEEIENKLKNKELNGATFVPNIDVEGNLSWNNDKSLENPETVNIRGPQGPQGVQGEAFAIKKTYSSKEEMNKDFANMNVGDYVMITSNVEVEDNAKLYCKGIEEWIFITDFSGSQGIQGPQGPQGIQGIQGPIGPKPVAGVDYFTDQDKSEMVSSITEDANSVFNQNASTKTDEFNTNATNKMNEFNKNSEDITNSIDELENILDKNTAVGEIVRVDDSKEYKAFETKILGNCEQETTTGKNLLPFPTDIFPIAGEDSVLTATKNDDGTIQINGNKETNGWSVVRFNFGKSITLPAGTYTTQIGLMLGTIIESGTYKNNGGTFIMEEAWHFSSGYYQTNSVGNHDIRLLPMLVSGSILGDFEPYTGGKPSPNPEYPQEIETITGSVSIKRRSKNLFDKNNVRQNYRFGSDGNYYNENGYYATEFIKVKPNTTYSTSWDITQTTCICTYDKNYNFIRRIQSNNKFTTSSEEEFIRASVRENQLSTAQIEQGNTKTSYEEHKGKIHIIDLKGNELAKVSDEVVDEIVIDKDSNVALIKNIGKVVIDETGDYTLNSSSDSMCNFSTKIEGLKSAKYIYGKENGKSNYFKYLMNTSTSSGIDKVYTTNDNVVFITSCANTIDEFKNWLSTHNVIVYYELAKPEILNLGKLSKTIETFEGTNYFYLESNLKSEIKITYVQDLKKFYENKKDESNVPAIETGKFISANGTVGNNASYNCTEMLSVNPGDLITATCNDAVSGGVGVFNPRFTACYKDKVIQPEKGSNTNTKIPYIVPNDVNGIVFSFVTRYTDVVINIYRGETSKIKILTKTYDDKLQHQQSQIDELKTLLSSTATSAMLLDNYQSDLESEV